MTRIWIDAPIKPAQIDELRGQLPDCTITLAERPVGDQGPLHAPADAQVVVCKTAPANFDALRHLRLLQLATVGYEHLRHLDLASRPFAICNARGIFDPAIGEWNLLMMLALTRDLRGIIRNQEASAWKKDDRFMGELRGATVGLWGYGGIGRETARVVKPLGMRIHVLTRRPIGPRGDNFTVAGTGDPNGQLPDRAFGADQEAEFLAGIDFLILALPHTRQSDRLVGLRQLRALEARHAFLLNPARGGIIDQNALIQALSEGWIAGAALDTHNPEPLPPDSPLWRMSNVIVTPHISGSDGGPHFSEHISALLYANMMRFLGGQPLLNRLSASEMHEV